MTRLNLNLARRPFTNDTLRWTLLGLLTTAVLVLGIWNVAMFLSTRSQVAVLAEKSTTLAERQRQAEQEEGQLAASVEASRSELLATRATFANGIIQQWDFSWTRLLNELETVVPWGVRLLNLRPRVDEGLLVRLNGLALDSESFWEFQENLLQSPVFGNVYPDVEQSTNFRQGLAVGERLISLELEYFPGVRDVAAAGEETGEITTTGSGPTTGVAPAATEAVPAASGSEAAGSGAGPGLPPAGQATGEMTTTGTSVFGTGLDSPAGATQSAAEQGAAEAEPVPGDAATTAPPPPPRPGIAAGVNPHAGSIRPGGVSGPSSKPPLTGEGAGVQVTSEVPKGSPTAPRFNIKDYKPPNYRDSDTPVDDFVVVGTTPDGRLIGEDGTIMDLEEYMEHMKKTGGLSRRDSEDESGQGKKTKGGDPGSGEGGSN